MKKGGNIWPAEFMHHVWLGKSLYDPGERKLSQSCKASFTLIDFDMFGKLFMQTISQELQ